MDPIESAEYDGFETSDHGWTKVENRKQRLKQKQLAKSVAEKESRVGRYKNLKAEEIKKTPKVSLPEAADKEKMPTVSLPESAQPKQVSLAEAAAKIDASHLASYLAYSPTWYPGIGLLNLVDYFGNALSKVSSEQFKYPWPNMNKLNDVADIPFTHIPQDVYKTAAQWVDQDVPYETVCSFVLWAFSFTHDRLVGRPTPPNKSQLAVFVVLSIIFRSKPRVLLTILPILRKPGYQTEDAHDRFQLTVWLIAQVSQDDLSLGLYSWSRNLLPLVGDKNKCKPESVDLVLQLVEKIALHPNAQNIILRSAVKGEDVRVIPMSSFEILLRLTFPDTSDRYTGRFKAVYPLLKDVALANVPGRKAAIRVTEAIFDFSFKFVGEGNPGLAEEATKITIWCLTNNPVCWRFWETNYYEDNPKASCALLKKLVEEWNDQRSRELLLPSNYSINILKQTLNNFLLSSKDIIVNGGARASLFKEADELVKGLIKKHDEYINELIKNHDARIAVLLREDEVVLNLEF